MAKIHSNRILVVDDEPALRETLWAQLKIDGYQVKTVNNGTQALEELEKQDYDFVFSDHIMDDMSAKQLVRTIKEKDPVQIVVTLTRVCQPFQPVNSIHKATQPAKGTDINSQSKQDWLTVQRNPHKGPQ